MVLVAASASYQADLFAAFLVPDLASKIHQFLIILPIIGEVGMLAYLLVVGVKSASPSVEGSGIDS